MRQSTKLVSNTLATFIRMALTVGVGLVTTRLLLSALGTTDFGLLGAIAATHFISSMCCASLLVSVQRHLAYEVGRQDLAGQVRVLNSSLALCGLAAVLFCVLGEVLAWFVMHGLKIPADRVTAAWWVYQATLAGVVITALMVPFQSLVAAHQELAISGIFDVFSSITRFGAVFAVLFIDTDRLIGFSGFNLLAQISVAMVLAVIVSRRYRDIRLSTAEVSRTEMRRLMDFSGWSVTGNLAWSLRQHASAILVNLRFGAMANAGFSIALQVATYAGNLGTAITRAVQPAIIAMEASGNRREVHNLTNVAGKYVTVLLSLVFVPFFIEAPDVLTLWLGSVPPDAVTLTRFAIVWVMVGAFRIGHDLAIQAAGDMRRYVQVALGLSIASLAAATIAVFVFGARIWVIPAATVALEVLQVAASVVIAGRHIGLSVRAWWARAALPTILVILIATSAALIAKWFSGVNNLAIVPLTYLLATLTTFWFLAVEDWERVHFIRIIHRVRSIVGARR
jgi:O-antigen/teichoic acid export membrane protein